MINNEVKFLYMHMLKHNYEIAYVRDAGDKEAVRADTGSKGVKIVCIAASDMKPWDADDFVFVYLYPVRK